MDRRELFQSIKKPFDSSSKEITVDFIKPPYFQSLENFEKCVECDTKDCATVCEEEIVIFSDKGIPYLDFSKNGCTFCDECATACESDVLQLDDRDHIQATLKIDIIKCMSWNQTMCFSCKDPCLDNAIEFIGMFRPEINFDKCTSCGFCMGVCPSDAITISKKGDSDANS